MTRPSVRVRVAVLLLVFVLCVGLGAAPAFAATTWTLAEDYVVRANPAAPVVKDAAGNDVWYFKLGSSPTDPGSFSATGLIWAVGGDPLFSWMPVSATGVRGWVRTPGGLPHVSVNTGADALSATTPQFLWRANKVLSHPMPDTDSRPYSVIEWRAPRAGTASFDITLTDVDPGGTVGGFQYWVLKNSTALPGADGVLVANGAASTPAIADVPVAAGESIHVVLGPGQAGPSGHSWDSTQMDIAITLPDPPVVSTPASSPWSLALLLVVGLGTIVAITRVRKRAAVYGVLLLSACLLVVPAVAHAGLVESVDDTDTTRIVYSPSVSTTSNLNWYRIALPDYYGTPAGYTNARLADKVATFSFTGTGVDWVTVKAWNQGIAEVRVDGVGSWETVDLYYDDGVAPSGSSLDRQLQQVVWGVRDLVNGPHFVEVRSTGTNRAGNPAGPLTLVGIDRFDVYVDVPPPVVSTSASSLWSLALLALVGVIGATGAVSLKKRLTA